MRPIGQALLSNCAVGASVSKPKVNEAVTSPSKAAQDADGVDRTIENSLHRDPGKVSRHRVTSVFSPLAPLAGHIGCSLGLESLQVRKRLSV